MDEINSRRHVSWLVFWFFIRFFMFSYSLLVLISIQTVLKNEYEIRKRLATDQVLEYNDKRNRVFSTHLLGLWSKGPVKTEGLGMEDVDRARKWFFMARDVDNRRSVFLFFRQRPETINENIILDQK